MRRLEHEPLDTEVPGDENSSGPTIERAQKLCECVVFLTIFCLTKLSEGLFRKNNQYSGMIAPIF